ncbi:MAG TPA: tetratricopeptide repeat protein [Vicinamibacterales bacterium]|jgi:Flp pilus assembly protein TadD|nr:tetratricopeptide repeat protein [Vicinamibacterales bacterium]
MRAYLRIGCAAATLALAAPAQAAPHWTYGTSEHFEVYTTAGENGAREALASFERIRGFFIDYLKLSPARQNPTRLVVFSGDSEFKPYRLNEASIAYYGPGPDRDVIVMRSLHEDDEPVAVHEYAHLVLQQAGNRFPVWFNEGIAEFFSTMAPFGGAMSIGRVPRDRLLYLSSGTALIGLPRLLAVERDSPEYNTKSHAGVFYSESWALVHMLLTDAHYRAASGQLIALMSTGTATAADIEHLYGKSLAAIAQDLVAYIHGGRYIYFSSPYREPATAQYSVRPATDFESGLATANLLAGLKQDEAAARAAFARLAADHPDDVSLVESEAVFELQHGHQDAARPLLRRAIALGSKSPRIYAQYAAMIGPNDPASAEPVLKTATSLAPDDLDLKLTYASVLMAVHKPADAIAVLQSFPRVAADRAYVYFNIAANAQLMLGDLDDAKASITRAASYARPGPEAATAKQTADGIDQVLAARARAKAVAASAADMAAATGAEAKPARRSIAGRMTNMVCGKDAPVVEVTTADAHVVRLVIDDPLQVIVGGEGDKQIDLQCGPQNHPVRVVYEPAEDTARHTTGKLRGITFTAP